MASRFVVFVALFAICHSSPVQINGIEEREGRAVTYGQGQSTGNGNNLASASVNGQFAQAYGNNNGAADGSNPGQATAQVFSGDGYSDTVSIPRAQQYDYYHPGAYQPQYYNLPAGYNRAVSAAKTTPLGSSANSYAQNANNGATIEAYNKPVPVETIKPAVIVAKSQNVPVPERKSVSWHFGTAYDRPAGYVVKAVEGSDVPLGRAALKSHSQTQGQGNADATAQQNAFSAVAASRSQSSDLGSSNSDSSVGPYGSVYYRNSAFNAGRLASQTRSTGNANSVAKAQNLGYSQSADSAASSLVGGFASSDSQSY